MFKTLIAAVFLCACLPQALLADRRSCAALYEEGPRQVSGHALASGKNLEREERGAGYALYYQPRGNARLSIFFYDRRTRRLADKDAAVEATASAIIVGKLREATGARDINLQLDDGGKVGQAQVFLATLTGRSEGRFTEQLAVVAHKNCYVKVRYTPSNNNASAIRKILREVTTHLAAGG